MQNLHKITSHIDRFCRISQVTIPWEQEGVELVIWFANPSGEIGPELIKGLAEIERETRTDCKRVQNIILWPIFNFIVNTVVGCHKYGLCVKQRFIQPNPKNAEWKEEEAIICLRNARSLLLE